LKIAAKVDRADVDYFNEEIRPLLDQPGIEYVGEISDAEKSEFLSGAVALLTLIEWPEPFGLVMIEAMACGTPVIAFPRGAVPEIIEDGVNGFIVADEKEAVSAVGRLGQLSRAVVRARFVERFTSRRMAEDYLRIYAKLVDAAPNRPSATRSTHLSPASLISLAASPADTLAQIR
jgi:glycosyltransferase involved in cell wall biosynthesis